MVPDRQRDPVATMIASDEASRTLGIVVDSWGDGGASARMTVRADMVNGYEIAHGGLVFALADTAFAAACNSIAAPTVAAAAEIVFVAPARLHDDLVAIAAVRTAFGRSGVYDVTVRRGDDVIAEFRGRSQQVRQ